MLLNNVGSYSIHSYSVLSPLHHRTGLLLLEVVIDSRRL